MKITKKRASYLLILAISLMINFVYSQSNRVHRLNLEGDSSFPDIKVNCISIKIISDTTYKEYGITSRYKRFQIESKIKIQTECNGTTKGIFDTAIATYEIAIAYDSSELLGMALIDSIYQEIKYDSDLFNCYPSCNWDKYLIYLNGKFVFYNLPGNNWENSYYTFYFSDFFIKVTYKGLKSKYGWGGLSSFLEELCYFSWGETIIPPGTHSSLSPKDFIILYENGRFK